jgi:hypothetical protein
MGNECPSKSAIHTHIHVNASSHWVHVMSVDIIIDKINSLFYIIRVTTGKL